MTESTQVPAHTAMLQLSLIQIDCRLGHIVLTTYEVAWTDKAGKPTGRLLVSVDECHDQPTAKHNSVEPKQADQYIKEIHDVGLQEGKQSQKP